MSHYLGGYTSLCETNFGCKMFVDTRDLSLAPHLLAGGAWEMWLTRLVLQYVRGAVFIDIGANVGWYTLLAAANGAKYVYSAEPNPRMIELLKRTMRVNGLLPKWELWEGALGDAPGLMDLSFDYELIGSGTLVGYPGSQTERTPIQTGDETFDVVDGDVVMKVDVEGFEARAVLGFGELLKSRQATVFVEHHSDPENTRRVVDMLDFFDANGYQLGLVTYESTIVSLTREKLADVPDIETLCFRKFRR